jgi:hypothetical protein
MLLITVILFIKSRNTLVSLLTFLGIMHFAEVNFVTLLFGKSILATNLNVDNIEIISICVFIFIFSFFIFNYNLKVTIRSSKIFYVKYKDIFLFLFLSAIFGLLFYEKVIINGGDFYKIAASKSALEEYLIPVFVVILLLNRNRILIIIPILMISILYGYTGERLKMLIQFFMIFLVVQDRLRFMNFKLLLFVALFLSLGIDSYRSVSNNNIANNNIRVSHFGELTRTSSMLIDFSQSKNLVDKGYYLVGIVAGNLLPSSILPNGLDIKRDLSLEIRVPGGGWFPMWFFAIGGYGLVFVISILVSLLSRYLHKKAISSPANAKKLVYLSIYIIFVSTSVNWMMYTPYQLIKFPIYSVIFIFLYYLLPRRV